MRWFFKTRPGEYGEGDAFLGVCVPQVRAAVKTFDPHEDEGVTLLRSRYHEERLAGLLTLVRRYERGDVAKRARVFDAYLASTARINNWDLVDLSAPNIVGVELLARGDTRLLDRLARSRSLWERRIAMVATLAFIRASDVAPALRVAEQLVDDEHDLIRKAVGWMLREVGKRDLPALRTFLRAHAATMPRTALRYAIEKLTPAERARWMGARGAPRT